MEEWVLGWWWGCCDGEMGTGMVGRKLEWWDGCYNSDTDVGIGVGKVNGRWDVGRDGETCFGMGVTVFLDGGANIGMVGWVLGWWDRCWDGGTDVGMVGWVLGW
jgi:hypothetical protein